MRSSHPDPYRWSREVSGHPGIPEAVPRVVPRQRLDGRPTVVLAAGRHRRRRRATYELVDLRESLTALATQEVPTNDGLSVKISSVVRWKVADPVVFSEVTVDSFAVVYLAVQVALREVVAGLAGEDVAPGVRADGAGRLVENPALARLRLVQALPYGTTLELRTDSD